MPYFNHQDYENKLNNFLDFTANAKAKQIFFIFSGTTYMNKYSGNRPNKLANELTKQKIPVIYSYNQGKQEKPLQTFANEYLFQIPQKQIIHLLEKIIHFDFRNKEKAFIISYPHLICAEYIDAFHSNGWVTVYDVRDDWEEFQKAGAAHWYNKNLERLIYQQADVICAVSTPLKRKMESYGNKKVYLSPNALDPIFFREKNSMMRKQRNPLVIGYFGHLTKAWFDWERLITIAKRKPEWTYELIGLSFPKIKLPPNIHYLGPKNSLEIKEISKRWNAAIIPFKQNPLSEAVDPIKVYDYLALELPVVSIDIPQIKKYPSVYIAKTDTAFIRMIEEVTNKSFDKEKTEKFLKNNLWEHRAKQLQNLVTEYNKK
ncbi:hypothetical protein J2Z40_000834 [Cytobacillus eiseniae]|uniref:Uncharacterized protein n=1 Tax=Cytobacillus eiseniae TaxID=762947 RepID=A0ABS4RCZ4_9BACI|nr:hypothetical protein [Cytobacillus eiseniae]MBP2240281.1 hypothetical protein [Cytobacillus eiseniae]